MVQEIVLRLQRAKHRCARAEDIHRLGIFRNALEHFPESCRQVSQPLQALLENVKLLPVWQGALQQQVGDLFKRGVRPEVLDVVTAVGEADSFLSYGADRGRASGLSAQTAGGSDWFSVAHEFKFFGFWYTVDPTCLRRSGNSERRTAAHASASGRRHLFESLCSVSFRKRELPPHSSREMRSKGIEQVELQPL